MSGGIFRENEKGRLFNLRRTEKMDTIGLVYLFISVVVLIGSVFVYSYLGRKNSAAAVLIVALMLFIISTIVGNSALSETRVGSLFAGLTRLTSVIGMVLGIIYLIRGSRLATKSASKLPQRSADSNSNSKSLKCKQCGLVDWGSESAKCKRCGSRL